MSDRDYTQRRDREVDTDRRGHSLQRRTGSQTGDEGSRERASAHGGHTSTPTCQSLGNPRTGSQRGTDSDLGISGEAGGQFGDPHGQRPSDAQRAGYHADDRVAGRSAHDYRFGSRRGSGHGSRRREDPRVGDDA